MILREITNKDNIELIGTDPLAAGFNRFQTRKASKLHIIEHLQSRHPFVIYRLFDKTGKLMAQSTVDKNNVF